MSSTDAKKIRAGDVIESDNNNLWVLQPRKSGSTALQLVNGLGCFGS